MDHYPPLALLRGFDRDAISWDHSRRKEFKALANLLQRFGTVNAPDDYQGRSVRPVICVVVMAHLLKREPLEIFQTPYYGEAIGMLPKRLRLHRLAQRTPGRIKVHLELFYYYLLLQL